jgi:hypothetical protein
MFSEVQLNDLYPYLGSLIMAVTMVTIVFITQRKAVKQEKRLQGFERCLRDLRDLRGFVELRLADDRPMDDRYALMGVASLLYHLESAYEELGPSYYGPDSETGIDKILPVVRKSVMDIINPSKARITLVSSNGILVDKSWGKTK